jgi:hypothetical protein
MQKVPAVGGAAFLLTAADPVELGIIESKLRAAQIPAFKKFREAGDPLNIVMGAPIYGVDLYVPSEQLEAAKELIEQADYSGDPDLLSGIGGNGEPQED